MKNLFMVTELIGLSGQKCCCQDTLSISWQSWPKTFKKHVGGVSLELCFSCFRSCFSHGNNKLSFFCWKRSVYKFYFKDIF